MVRADSHGIPRAPWYSGAQKLFYLAFHLQGYHFLWLSFPEHSIKLSKSNIVAVSTKHLRPTTPIPKHTQVITWYRFRLFPFRSPLLRESLCFLFLALLRCFSSRRSPLYPMYSDKDTLVVPEWVSPFGNLRIKAWLTAPRSLWQPSASFIASWYQGIHRMPFSINHEFVYHLTFYFSVFKLQIFQRSQEFFFILLAIF